MVGGRNLDPVKLSTVGCILLSLALFFFFFIIFLPVVVARISYTAAAYTKLIHFATHHRHMGQEDDNRDLVILTKEYQGRRSLLLSLLLPLLSLII